MSERNLNFWLTDKEFISKSKYNDLYYLEGLCYRIASFLKNTPIHVITILDNTEMSIGFSIGTNKKYYPISNDISFYDYITEVEKWLKTFYPSFDYMEELEVELSEEEMKTKIKEGMNLNDVLLLRKKSYVRHYGVVEKIYLKDDCFLLNYNGNLEKRTSICTTNAVPVSKFMEKLRTLSEKERYEYIKNDSVKLHDITEKQIEIDYAGKTMLNFFEINYDVLKEKSLIKVSEFVYTWGRFVINFNSPLLRDDCLKLYNKLLIGKNND